MGQNFKFDLNIMGCEFYRSNINTELNNLPVLDTCTEKTALMCQIPGGRYGKFKLPTFTELHEELFKQPFQEAHNATADVEATTRCFLELLRNGNYSKEELQVDSSYFVDFTEHNKGVIPPEGLKHLNLKKESEKISKSKEKTNAKDAEVSAHIQEDLQKASFAHLHNHSQYSILQSTSGIKDLVAATASNNMPAVALTDTGNMMGAFVFVKEILNHNKNTDQAIKPIVGCEFNVCENHLDKSFKDNGYQVVLLAKNKNGYHNLAKLASAAFIDGFYYVPRIDKKLIQEYKEDVIVLSGGVNGEIPNKILNIGEHQAEQSLLWWKDNFKDDFYLEISDHQQENEKHINEVLIGFSKKHQVKLIATNNTFYLKKSDSMAHDILLCVKDGEKIDTPKGRGRGFRYGLPNDEYYFKGRMK